jgi:hypothetical protein
VLVMHTTSYVSVWGTGSGSPRSGGFNALDRKQYSMMLPGYLSLGTSNAKIKRIVPSPTKILLEPMPNEKYCIYAAFGGITLRKVKFRTSSTIMYRQST